MVEQGPESLGAGLVYEDTVPLAWRPVPDLQGLHAVRIQNANEEFLRVVSALEGQPPEGDETNEEVLRELQRLDAKIDLLLELVGKVLTAHTAMPESVPIRLSGASIEWTTTHAPEAESDVLIEVFLRPSLPQPLTMPARIVSVDAVGAGFKVVGVLGELCDPLQEWIERMIFRQHRRRVADARRGPRPV